jgi:hypothetical protein
MTSGPPKARTKDPDGDQWCVLGASGPEKQLLDHDANKITFKGKNLDSNNLRTPPRI